MRYKAEDFPFLIKPDKNNKAILKALDEIKKSGCVIDGCMFCPFESKGHVGCFSSSSLGDSSKMVELYKKTFFNNIVQEEMDV